MHTHGGGEAVYGLGLIGALVYYLQHGVTLGDKVLGILKAVVWPALVTYNGLGYLKMQGTIFFERFFV